MDFDLIIRQYSNKIYKYCFHMLRHRQEAEDAAQEVFLKAYQHYSDMKDVQAIGLWLYKTAYRHCLNIIKKKRLLSFVSMIDTHIESMTCDTHYDDIDGDITAILNKLSPSDRNIFILRVLEDKTYEDISRIMDISSSAARKQYERAKNRIKKLLKIEMEENINEKISII